MRVGPAMITNELSKHSEVRPKGLKSKLETEKHISPLHTRALGTRWATNWFNP